MFISGISFKTPKKDIFLPDRCTPIFEKGGLDMNENTNEVKVAKAKIAIILRIAFIGALVYLAISIIHILPVIIKEIQVRTNEKYAIYEEARKSEADDYDTFRRQNISLDIKTMSDVQTVSLASNLLEPVSIALPKIESEVDMNKAEHLVGIVIRSLPENIAKVVVDNYTIIFKSKPLKERGNYYTAGIHDPVKRTIQITFDGTNWKSAITVLAHEIGHLVFGQTLETFIDAGYIYKTDLTPINFHGDLDNYSLIYDEYMAQAFAEYVFYNENLKESDPRFYATMEKAIESFSFDRFCYM